MSYGIIIKIWGDYALFTRPEMKVERVSYDVITPSAARGILEAIYWKPEIKWIIDEIHVLNKIRFENIKRNEVSCKLSTSNFSKAKKTNTPFSINIEDNRQPRSARVLKNVCYVVKAHFIMTDKAYVTNTPEKQYNIILRRLINGQHFHMPYLGCREFPAHVKMLEDEKYIPKSKLKGITKLGRMLYDMKFAPDCNSMMDYKAIQPQFFEPNMLDGIIDLTEVKL